MAKVTSKRCRMCGEVKPASEYYCRHDLRDGLSPYCKLCTKIYVGGGKITNKRCCVCNLVKPIGEYSRDIESNRLAAYCKACEKSSHKENHKKLREQICHSPIQTWEQVGSVLRSMSELQYAIMVEAQSLKERIATLKSLAMKPIGAWHGQLTELGTMVEGFLRCNHGEDYFEGRVFEFGSISHSKAGIDIKLKPKLAGKRIGKP